MLGKALGAAIALVAVVATINQATAKDDPPASGTSPAASTVIEIKGAAIDTKYPGRVQVSLTYTCATADGARSLTASVEQTDPGDPEAIAFGSNRTTSTAIVCDGTPQSKTIAVSSKTTNWVEGVDGVVVATVSNIGSTPPAAADAQQITLNLPPAAG